MKETIGTQSMICAIELGLPRQATQLKLDGAEIEAKNKAEKGTVRPPSIQYFRKKNAAGTGEIDGLQMLKDVQNEYKKRILLLARYPYSGGFYLAPAAVVPDLLKLQEQFEYGGEAQSKMQVTWTKWATEIYPEWVDTAPTRMGDLFKKDDFPTMAQCKKGFKMRLTILPLGEKEQVDRITLISPQHNELLKKHAEETQSTAIGDLRKQIWKDLVGPLQQVVTVFEKDKPKIYESLLGNLLQIVNIIPAYDSLIGDPNLSAFAEQAKTAFESMTTEDLRKSDDTRKVALVAAKKLLTDFDPFAREFVDDEPKA